MSKTDLTTNQFITNVKSEISILKHSYSKRKKSKSSANFLKIDKIKVETDNQKLIKQNSQSEFKLDANKYFSPTTTIRSNKSIVSNE